jgi:ankyrin repeat protein
MCRAKWVSSLIVCVMLASSLAADRKQAGEVLLAAAAEGDVDAMRQALKDGADPNVKDENGNTPLMMVSVDMLFGEERSIIPELVAKKAKVDHQNAAGMTALMYAARENRTENVKALLAAGAKPDVRDGDGWTALMYASYNGSWGSFDELVAAKASVSLEDAEGWTPMMLAISNGKGVVVERLQKAGAKVPTEFHGASTLFYAIESGDLTSFRAVLAAGGDVNAPDPDGWTPLAWAAAGGHEQMVMDLLRAGADPAIKDNEDKTPLDRASESELTEIAALLGGEWKKPAVTGTKVSVPCQALGGSVDTWFSTDETTLVAETVFPRPVSWYIGGGLTNRASTSKTLTHDGVAAGTYHRDVDNDAKTGAQPDMLNPARKGVEFALDHSEYGTSVTYRYRTAQGETRERQVSANVIDVSVYRGDDLLDSEAWTDSYPHVVNDSGVLRTVVPLEGLGLKKGRKITVTTEFGKCVSKPTVVTLK